MEDEKCRRMTQGLLTFEGRGGTAFRDAPRWHFDDSFKQEAEGVTGAPASSCAEGEGGLESAALTGGRVGGGLCVRSRSRRVPIWGLSGGAGEDGAN